MNSKAETQIAPQDTWTSLAVGGIGIGSGTTPAAFGNLFLGDVIRTRDGRIFKFGRVGAVAAVAGSMYQAPAPVANHLAQTPAAAAIGATSVTITTLGATAATQNQYAGGWMQIDTTPGQGRMYGIDSHLANAGSAALILNLVKDDPIQIALTTASRVGLIANPYAGVIIVPTTQTNIAIGVPTNAYAIGAYGWFQVGGPCALLMDGTPAAIGYVVNSASVAGAGAKWTTAAADVAVQVYGHMMQTGVDTKNNAVFLTLAV